MREYLFRGWSEFCKKWVYGSLIRWDDYCCILHRDVHPADEPYLDEFGTIDGRATPVVPESVGEWTGMCDISGRKIFEGDIMKTAIGGLKRHTGVVAFTDGAFGLRCTDGDAFFLCFVAENYEVVGNVFENADLLEG